MKSLTIDETARWEETNLSVADENEKVTINCMHIFEVTATYHGFSAAATFQFYPREGHFDGSISTETSTRKVLARDFPLNILPH